LKYKVLITGTAGFIGYHLVSELSKFDVEIIGLDNINNYYDKNLKISRLASHGVNLPSFNTLQVDDYKEFKSILLPNYTFIYGDMCNKPRLDNLFETANFDLVINLAAQAGVRYSLENPDVYIENNISGFLNILESSRNYNCRKLIYASTSSVYGLNTNMPFSEDLTTDHPVSLYATTKKCNELMAHTYSHLFGLETIGLRFFTVYGPWGRPDMALFKFVKGIIENEPIDLYNNGEMYRDFTYVEDVAKTIQKLVFKIDDIPYSPWDPSSPSLGISSAPFRIFNIGNSEKINLKLYLEEIENALGKKAIVNGMPLQMGDVLSTLSKTDLIESTINFSPNTSVRSGINRFVLWYKEYYKII
jgi:UDP-glucuronate 4-epimerase